MTLLLKLAAAVSLILLGLSVSPHAVYEDNQPVPWFFAGYSAD